MDTPDVVVFHPTAHPVPEVHRFGFPLDHPYVEHCWTPSLGPTSVLLMRRVASLWQERTPAVVPTSDLGRMLGVGPGTGRQGALWRTLERIVRLRFGAWTGEPGELALYSEVPPLLDRQLHRVPAPTRRAHERLLSAHLEHLTQGAARDTPATPVSDMTARLDRLELRSPNLSLSR